MRAHDTPLVPLPFQTQSLRRALVVLTIACGLGDVRAQSPDAEDPVVAKHAFVEMIVDPAVVRDGCVVGQVVPVRIRFGVEVRFLQGNLIQMFRQRVGMPVQLQVDWWRGMDGATAKPEKGLRAGVSFVLNDRLLALRPATRRRKDGNKYYILEARSEFTTTKAGKLTFTGPRLKMRYATEFRDDFARGRVPVNPRDGFVRADTIEILVKGMPKQPSPPGYRGAIGTFRIEAGLDTDEVAVNGAVRLRVTIQGSGNLEKFPTPELPRWPGIHVLGTKDDHGARQRTILYDLSPQSESVHEIPPVELVYFDLSEGDYRTIGTAAKPIRVIPGASGAGEATAKPEGRSPAAALEDLKPRSSVPLELVRPPSESGGSGLLIWLLVPWGVFVAIRLGWRAQASRRTPASRRAQMAAAQFHAAMAQPDAGAKRKSDAFSEYLAARLRQPVGAVVDHDLTAQLTAAGVDSALAVRAADAMAGLAAARFSSASALTSEALAPLVTELERAFTRGRS